MGARFLSDHSQWDAVASFAESRGLMGVDTETYGHSVRESSPAFRARIHVWSVAFMTDKLSPRGFHVARGAVLPAAALEHAGLRSVLENPSVRKVAHNARHDRHAFLNHGIVLRNVVDTLDMARLAWPERALDRRLGFGLKALARDILGKPARPEFEDVTEAVVDVFTDVTVRKCVCGQAGCRKRTRPDHEKTDVIESRSRSRRVTYPLEEILPGHPHRDLLEEYAAADAEDAPELAELAASRLRALDDRMPALPW